MDQAQDGAATALTITGAVLDGEPVGMRAAQGRFVAIGPDVSPEPGDDVLDAAGATAVPPMVNAHTHAAMTLFRSFGDDLPLMTWLQTRIWPAEARLTEDDVYWGTRLACAEMIRSGTSTFVDMYWHPGAVARAVHDSGMRGIIGAALADAIGGPSATPTLAEEALDAMSGSADDGRVVPALGPHAVYTVGQASLQWVAERAGDSIPITIHLAETEGEVRDCVAETGMRPVELLDRCGVLGPRTIVAHGCWLEPDELELLAARGTTVAAVPVSNMKLAVGRHFPYPQAAAAGVPIALGTDGVASNNSLDLFSDLKVFALVQKFDSDDPSTLPAAEALAVARGQRSPVLGGHALEAGQPADVALVRTDGIELSPGHLEANLVYAANGSAVDALVVAGRVVMRDRVVDGVDEVIDEVRERARALRST